jgi:hypothetical protein
MDKKSSYFVELMKRVLDIDTGNMEINIISLFITFSRAL